MTVKILIKRVFSKLLSSTGILFLAERFILSDRAAILMYHRVLSTAENGTNFIPPGMYVSPASFEKQISFLRDRFEVVFLDELVEKILNKENIARHCAITFDDGWRDNYTAAFPILEKYRIPITIFLATGFVGTNKMFWPEEICNCFQNNKICLSALNNGPPALIRLLKEVGEYRQGKQEKFLNRIIEILKGYSPGQREEILEYLRSTHNAAVIPREMLSWYEARKMLASGLVRFGAHTVNHEILNQVSLQKARGEISQSRQEIERRLGSKVRLFAYPNGNHNKCIQMILDECGFEAAVTTCKGLQDCGMPLMEIPRVAIHEDISNTIPMFRSRILFRQF